MKNLQMTLLITTLIFIIFYAGGTLANASFNLALWANRETLFGVAIGVILVASAMSVVINSDDKK